MLEVIVSPITGFCFGVKRAMRLIAEGLGNGGRTIYSIGDVIHNSQAVEDLKSRGVIPVSSMDELSEGDTLIIRAHGVMPDLIEEARGKGIELIDTTCPFVQKSQKYVRQMAYEGRKVIIIGDSSHPEVRAISGQAGPAPVIISTLEEAKAVKGIDRAGVVIQTTLSREKAMRIIGQLEDNIPDLRVHDTICQATVLRREATLELARDVDMVLVVGGKGSSNTKRLFQMCIDEGITARFIETADEIDPSWFKDGDRIGLTTGTSTPDWVIDDVLARLREISDC
ncbi:MAG: 4-hydroxy-3-methylbut-2-enyl diphosphate reductase [Candidatus Krumholzibacteria bacterium]|nr:4-hydroxy-3-methylbut-2-enyl diphosphate reductase [Candidatus Krumholzibacteria bacterium]